MKLLILFFTAIISFSATAQGAFTARPGDFKPKQVEGEAFSMIQKTSCQGHYYGIVYQIGGFIASAPIVRGMCAWENRFDLDRCLADDSAELRACWNKAVDYYGLSRKKATDNRDDVPVIDSAPESIQ